MRNSGPAPSADALEALLRSLGTPERAAGQKAYLKSDLEFFGCTVGQARTAVKACLASAPAMGHDALVAFVEELWGPPIHERRQAAVLVLQWCAHLLDGADLPLIERLARSSLTWAYVDVLAGDVALAFGLAELAVGLCLRREARVRADTGRDV
ncbi:MAG: hypothetical protein NVSMB32_11450 [Actinomycetota bacterium]